MLKHGRHNRYFVATTGSSETTKGRSGYERIAGKIFEARGIRILGKGIDVKEEEKIKIEMRKSNHGYVVVRHYGHLRGTNVAIHANIGILLGKYKVSDALEVAWSIPFIQDVPVSAIEQDGSVRIKDMQDHFVRNKVKSRRYKSEFECINRIVEWQQRAEFEQAIGRTRFIMHDVTIYAVTKDDISPLGIFETPEEQIRLDEDGMIIFGDREDSTYFFSKKALDVILTGQNSFTKTELLHEVPRIARMFRVKPPEVEAVEGHIRRYCASLAKKGIRYSKSRTGNTVIYKILDWYLPKD